MRIPEKRVCDLCKNEMPTGVPMVGINYPLDQADYDALHLDAPPAGVLGLGGFVVPHGSSYIFEVCRPCVDGILPMLQGLKTEYLLRLLEERRAAMARRLGE